MRRTTKQIKKDILDAILSSSQVIKTSEIMKAKNLTRETVNRYKDEVYEDITARIRSFNIILKGLPIKEEK
jgi:hypothetical protein